MTTFASTSPSRLASQHHALDLFAELREFWREFFVKALDPYRPERHYMRGPGPAWRAKHAASSNLHST